MTTTHTPGPWREKRGFVVSEADNSLAIAAIEWPEVDESKANARLIAAAPDLLAACKMAVEFIQNGVEFGFIRIPADETDRAHRTLPLLMEVIAKAEGGAA